MYFKILYFSCISPSRQVKIQVKSVGSHSLLKIALILFWLRLILEQKIKKIQENKAQSGGQLRQSPAEQVEQYRQMIEIIKQKIKGVKGKNKAQSGGQLRQSPAEQVERYRHMIKIIEQEIKEIQENKAQSGGQLRQSPAEQVEQYRQMIEIIKQKIKEVEGKNNA